MTNNGEKPIVKTSSEFSPQRGENSDERELLISSDGLNGNDGIIDYRVTEDILSDSMAIIDSSQRVARRAVNVSLVLRNWFLGKRIVEEELRGATRSELYGRELIVKLADELNTEYGKGFGKSNLYQYVKFYRLFPEIFHGNSGKSPSLTWTHYRHLLRVEDPDARAWYEKEAVEQSWAEGTLDRNIATQYYYRMLMTADKNKPFVEEVRNVAKTCSCARKRAGRPENVQSRQKRSVAPETCSLGNGRQNVEAMNEGFSWKTGWHDVGVKSGSVSQVQ